MTPAAASSAADAIDAALLEGQGLLRLAIVEAENVHTSMPAATNTPASSASSRSSPTR
jgi:hypothetical protein